jgi:acylphosphatase
VTSGQERRPPAEDRARLEAVVTGRVQGVGFRVFVLAEARDLDLDGWVANQDDGSVACTAEGPRTAVERLLDQLRAGPRGARVVDVRARWSPARGIEPGFRVRSGRHPGD